ncbi:hypothetical protein Hanom_Chr14g01253051 [Helianthus anomalus]
MRMKMRAAIAMANARNTFTFGGCLRTHVRTTWIGFFVFPFILSLSLSLSQAGVPYYYVSKINVSLFFFLI